MGTGNEIKDGVDGYTVTYSWFQDNQTVFIDSSKNVCPKTLPGAIPATGKYPYIIIGAEDIEDGKSSNFTVNVNVDKI
jgi:hypothetical protein